MTQPIFYTNIQISLKAVESAKERYSVYPYAFGESTSEDVNELIKSLAIDNNSNISISKLANELTKLETRKMPAGANMAIRAIIKEVNASKFTI